jgi:hypothetical protein
MAGRRSYLTKQNARMGGSASNRPRVGSGPTSRAAAAEAAAVTGPVAKRWWRREYAKEERVKKRRRMEKDQVGPLEKERTSRAEEYMFTPIWSRAANKRG